MSEAVERLEDLLAAGGISCVSQWPDVADDVRAMISQQETLGLRLLNAPDVEGEGPYLVILMEWSRGISLTRFKTLSEATLHALGYTGPKWLFEVGDQHGFSYDNVSHGLRVVGEDT